MRDQQWDGGRRLTPQVTLDTGHGKHDLVLVLVGDLLAAPAPVIVAAELKNVRSQVVTLKDQVLDNEVDHRVLVLNTRNGDVADVLEERREDDIGQVLDQVRLELSLAVLVVAEIEEELVHGLAETLVERVLVELVNVELELVKNAVSVVAVAVAEEKVALVVELVPLISGSVLEDKALLLQATTDVGVDLLEPVLELWVAVGVAVDLVDRVEHVVEGGAVGETFDDGLQINQHWL